MSAILMEQYPKIYLFRRLVQAKLFIDENFADRLDLENISDEACFSKFHFIRLFRNVYGKTPHRYLTTVRIEKAKILLTKNIPVSEVCYAVGFESLPSFSGLFRKLTGCSPSEYMQQQQKIKTQLRTTPLRFIPGCFADQYGWSKKAISEK